MTAAELVSKIEGYADDIDGVSVSGGEPFEQLAALGELVRELRARLDLSILVFSGFRREELERDDLARAILADIDVLIDGRFVNKQRLARELRGSKNQNIHVLSSRLTRKEVEATPAAEVKITPEGDVILTGVDPLSLDE